MSIAFDRAMGSDDILSSDKKVAEIMAGMKCPKNFQCAESGFKHLCEAKVLGLENHLNCLEKDPLACSFSLKFGDCIFCHCRLRLYLFKKLKR